MQMYLLTRVRTHSLVVLKAFLGQTTTHSTDTQSSWREMEILMLNGTMGNLMHINVHMF